MSLSPSDILERMEKLKKWQEEQELLMLQHHKRLNHNNSSDKDCLQNIYTESTTILPHIDPMLDSVVTVFKPKRPFLRRGSGLSRFKMAPGEQFKPLNKRKSVKKSGKSPEMLTILNASKQLFKPKCMWTASTSEELNSSLRIFEELEKKLKENSIATPTTSTPTKQPIKRDMFHLYAWHTSRSQEYNTANDLYEAVKNDNESMIQKDKQQLEDLDQYEKRLQGELLASLEQAIKFKEFLKQDKAVGSSSPISSISNGAHTPTSEAIKEFDDIEQWTSNVSIASSSSTVSSSQVMNEVVTHNVGTMTEDTTVVDRNMEKIEHLQEYLKHELKVAQEQSNEAKQLRKQYEQQTREIEKQRISILKKAEESKDDIAQSNAKLEEERKKLQKERMVFERYMSELQNRPNRKEREEISHLSLEITTLKETYKLKEIKNSTTQARLRNQIKYLEKEISDVKLHIEKLTKENGRLIASQQLARKPSDTKLLHEINKNISKLAQDQLNKIIGKQHPSSNTIISKEKENNNSSNSSDTEKYPEIQNTSVDHERNYDETRHSNIEDVQTSRSKPSNRVERIKPDGSRVITYSNGNIKTVSIDGNVVEFKYSNGDMKTTNLLEGSISYYYNESKVCHTTNADGTEILEYPNGEVETRLKSGKSEIKYPNGITVLVDEQGDRILLLPNGQKEIHTKDHKRREYPDGTVKLLYPDGRQETRYSNGRVRIKNKDGALLFDSLT